MMKSIVKMKQKCSPRPGAGGQTTHQESLPLRDAGWCRGFIQMGGASSGSPTSLPETAISPGLPQGSRREGKTCELYYTTNKGIQLEVNKKVEERRSRWKRGQSPSAPYFPQLLTSSSLLCYYVENIHIS